MALLIFPPNPTNGQEFNASNGVTYTYQSSPGVWTAGGSGGGGVIPAGSIMSFFQAAAPTGWVQITTQNNKTIRIVGGAGGGSGGTIPFTTLFSPTSTYSGSINITSGQVGDTTLSEAQLASHAHNFQGAVVYVSPGSGSVQIYGGPPYGNTLTDAAGGNAAHTHSLVGANANGNFTSNFAVEYIDMILATKS
jgi:hypothetical protein